MKTQVLYFPYIGFPDSAWATRMLLYWDSVGSIVPSAFIRRPERLDDYSRQLVQAGLLTQIVPGWYTGAIPRFAEAFIDYLDSLGTAEIERRRGRFLTDIGHGQIHVEKLSSLANRLIDLKIAKREDREWCWVEAETAIDFMIYLAAVLGRLPDLEFQPITDHFESLQRFSRSGKEPLERLEPLRIRVLEHLLPGPENPLRVHEIEFFKRRHGDTLKQFRRRVEQELIGIADVQDPFLQERRLELFLDEAEEEIGRITSLMKSSGFGNLLFGKIGAVGAAIPGVHWVVGLAAAAYSALGSSRDPFDRSPWLYAAYARDELRNAAPSAVDREDS